MELRQEHTRVDFVVQSEKLAEKDFLVFVFYRRVLLCKLPLKPLQFAWLQHQNRRIDVQLRVPPAAYFLQHHRRRMDL